MKGSKILVGVNKTETASRAVATGAQLASRLGGELALVTVIDPRLAVAVDGGLPPEQMQEVLRKEADELLASFASEAAAAAAASFEARPIARLVREGSPGDEIVAAAREWEADIIVVGTRAKGGLRRLLLGSTAEQVVRNAPCPVLVIPPAEQEEENQEPSGE